MTYQLEIKPLQGAVTTEELLQVAHLMFSESRFANLGVAEDKLFLHVHDILTNPQWLAFGAFEKGVLCGMVIGLCGAVLPFSSAVVATEHYLYLRQEYRGGKESWALVKAFIAGAKHRGAKDVIFSNGYGGDPTKVERLFEKCGLIRIGSIFTLGD